MNSSQVNTLLNEGTFRGNPINGSLIETHISWVILSKDFVFKIKKPRHYSFLDFSTLAMRKHYCEREVKLNARLSDIYLDVIPVVESDGYHFDNNGKIVDYAVRMKRIDSAKRMDLLVEQKKVDADQIKKLADHMARFHSQAQIMTKPFSIKATKNDFNDIAGIMDWVRSEVGMPYSEMIVWAIAESDHFLEEHQQRFRERISKGFSRDVHGDLHTRNIFLCEDPIIFDCIEFSDPMRQIDVLNEVAFFCMDLEALGEPELSFLFMLQYLESLPMLLGEEDHRIFNYYKAYRANVRAKVNALRGMQSTADDIDHYIQEVKRYLKLAKSYLVQLR